jgi:hypothetical protein
VKREAPPLAGAPCVPGQRTWLRYTTDPDGRIDGLWAFSNAHGAEPIEIPVTHIVQDWPLREQPTFTFTVPAHYVSEAR